MRRSAAICLMVLAYVFLSAQSPGERAPEFALKDTKGSFISVGSMRGKVVLVNFWATWCPPCREELPLLNQLHREYSGRGLRIMAVSPEDAEDVKAYLESNPVLFHVLPEGYEASRKYGVYSIPTSFIIDKGGFIAERYPGWVDWSSPEIKKKIEGLLR